MHKDLTLDEVLAIEANTDLAAVVTMKGSVKLRMLTTPTFASLYEVKFKMDSGATGAKGYFSTNDVEQAILRFNQYAMRL